MKNIAETFTSEEHEDYTTTKNDDYDLNTDDLEPSDYEDELGDRVEQLAENCSDLNYDID